MRVISQNGIYDFPYKQVAVYRDETNIVCRFQGVEKSKNILGIYSTEEKAEMAMEMMRSAYRNFDYIRTTGNTENLNALYEILGDEEFRKTTSPYFKFPRDEEMEV